jgi:hypothetical protein
MKSEDEMGGHVRNPRQHRLCGSLFIFFQPLFITKRKDVGQVSRQHGPRYGGYSLRIVTRKIGPLQDAPENINQIGSVHISHCKLQFADLLLRLNTALVLYHGEFQLGSVFSFNIQGIVSMDRFLDVYYDG